MIPKRIHIVWVGDESKKPGGCIQSWVDLNPTWAVKVWGNEEFKSYPWSNRKHLDALWNSNSQYRYCGIADIMRYEILLKEGGFAMDADGECVRPLEDWLIDCTAFTCWESELLRPGLLSVGYMAAEVGNPLMGRIVGDILLSPTVLDKPAWLAVGPVRFTDNWRKMEYWNLTIYPSHYFLPKHFATHSAGYTGNGPVFARQYWNATYKGNRRAS